MEFSTTPLERARSLEALIRNHADESERQRHLHADVAKAFAETGLYRIAAPKDCFGEEVDPCTQLAAIEVVSGFDATK